MTLNTALQEEISVPKDLMVAERLRLNRQLDEAMTIVAKYMNDHFEDVPAISLAANICMDAERIGMAQAFMKFATILQPESSVLWSNLGVCYRESSELEEGEKCFIKALTRDPNNTFALNGLTQLYINMGQPLKAINCADKALNINPKDIDVQYNRGLALLQLGQWREGWKSFDANLGGFMSRKERIYGTIPRWTGVKDLTVIAYGEQGIGDEIFFSSCVPDLMKQNKVILECDKRLENLFKRSFGCDVYGTRYQKELDWLNKHQIDASVALGSLPGFFRNEDEDFPGTPYLKPDPERVVQWRALLDSMGPKMKIGVAWTGGIRRTGTKMRSVSLDDLKPILRQDADFISLQYKNCPEIVNFEKETGVKIHHWPHAMQTNDYDDTVALISQLDLVISVTQAAIHVAGATGVPCWVMTPKAPMWRYKLSGDRIPWYKSVKLYRQKTDWVHVVSDIATDLRKLISDRNT